MSIPEKVVGADFINLQAYAKSADGARTPASEAADQVHMQPAYTASSKESFETMHDINSFSISPSQ